MLSRVADSLFWMSRYLERAEHTVRVVDVNIGLMLDRSSTSAERRWKRILVALGNPGDIAWEGNYDRLIDKLIYDDSASASVTSCIVSARENARQARDEISSEQWQQINKMYHYVTQTSTTDNTGKVAEFAVAVTDGLYLFQGVTDSTMTHGEGWHFIQVGRYIERATATANILDVYQHEVFGTQKEYREGEQYLEWIGLLRCCTAFEAYCHIYTADLSQERILEFLLLNQKFPHSLRYSIDGLQQALQAIQNASGRHAVDELNRVAGRLQASLSFVEVQEVLEQDTAAYLHNVLRQCRQVHDLIYRYYIHYSVEAALAM